MPDHPRDALDPKGLIFEAFRIEGITEPECRSIFVDWALSVEVADMVEAIKTLLTRHCDVAADHPMLVVLREGLGTPPQTRRRGGRAGRRRG